HPERGRAPKRFLQLGKPESKDLGFGFLLISAPPRLNFIRPLPYRRPNTVQFPFEEMVPALDPDYLFRLWHCVKDFLQLRARAILVARAADKQLGLGALRKKLVAVQTLVHLHRRPQRDEPQHP